MPSRRRFVTRVAAGGLLAGLGVRPAAAGSIDRVELAGTEFDLTIGEAPFDATGRTVMATVVNGTLPAPLLRFREGTTVTLRVTNRLAVPTSIHWHGLILPYTMDGVPGLSFDGIAPGQTFVYRFPVRQSGTYWYHSHSGFQEQTGLYGPIVIEPQDGERHRTERDHVVLLSDWSDDRPETVMKRLKQMSDVYNFIEPTAVDFARDAQSMGIQQALAKRAMWNTMRMSPADLSDVTGHHYTYLVNGKSPDGNWTGTFARGERVRLRIVNGSSQSIFDFRIPGLKMTVVATDGQDVEPVTVDEFRIAAAETYDVIVEPDGDRAYTLFAQSIDRMGCARGTLTPRVGMTADVPPMDRPQWLSMTDMMGSMAMGGDMAGMDHGAMADMNDGRDGRHGPRRDATDVRAEARPPRPHRVRPRRRHARGPAAHQPRRSRCRAARQRAGASSPTPTSTQSAARSTGADRVGEIELHLTGNMERYIWSFDGQKFADSSRSTSGSASGCGSCSSTTR